MKVHENVRGYKMLISSNLRALGNCGVLKKQK